MRIEADNLQEAFSKAAKQLNCSVTELDIKVIQHPRGGVFGMFKKTAIIEATREGMKEDSRSERSKNRRDRAERGERPEKKERKERKERTENPKADVQEKKTQETKSDEAIQNDGEQKPSSSRRRRNRRNRNRKKNQEQTETVIESVDQVREQEQVVAKQAVKEALVIPTVQDEAPEIIEIPYADLDLDASTSNEVPVVNEIRQERTKKPKEVTPQVDMAVAIPEIYEGVTRLIKSSCFAIEEIKVEPFNDETVLIEFNGEDAALLIGKEGYRYKAFSYLLYNWVNIKYGLGIRLEIAEFLKNQEEMIDKYLLPVIDRINSNGRGQTKPLDGVLIKIALERLRTQFPEKYVGIKSGREGGKFVVVNDFNRKNS